MASKNLTSEKIQHFRTKLQSEPGAKVLYEYAQYVGIPANTIIWEPIQTNDGTFQQFCIIQGKQYQPGSKEARKQAAKHSASKKALDTILSGGSGKQSTGAVQKTHRYVTKS